MKTPRRLALPVLMVLLVSTWMHPTSAVAPLQDDAGSGGDAGDLHVLASSIGPGLHQGTLVPLSDARDVYRFQGAAGDAVGLALFGDATSKLTLSLWVRVVETLDPENGWTTFGTVSPGGYRTIYLPYDAEWHIVVESWSSAGSLQGDTTYTFELLIEPDVADVFVLEAAGAVFEITDLDGVFQYHMFTELRDGQGGVVRRVLEMAHRGGSGWQARAYVGEFIRTDSGRWLVAGPAPETPFSDLDFRGTGGHVTGSIFRSPADHAKVELSSTGQNTHITFAVPKGATASFAAVNEMLLRSTDDLEGDGLRTPVYQDVRASATSILLNASFGGGFHPWGMDIRLRAPSGDESAHLPWSPSEGTWTIVAEDVEPLTMDTDLPLLWGAHFPSLGIYPKIEPEAVHNSTLIFRDWIPG